MSGVKEAIQMDREYIKKLFDNVVMGGKMLVTPLYDERLIRLFCAET